jgi:hypothetical protein
MLLLSLKRYCNGYTGFWLDEESYIFFAIRRTGSLKRLLILDRAAFDDYRHFLYVMGRFFPSSSFLKEPLSLSAAPSPAELDRLWSVSIHQIEPSRPVVIESV